MRTREIDRLRRAVAEGAYRPVAARIADRLIAESRRFASFNRAASKRMPG
jgi:hypothetical protein